jgi:uncharacterized protein (TIGR03083 family)
MARLGYERYYRELEAEAALFVEVTRGADPAMRVPTCPEWTLPTLIEHLGRAHRWAATIVSRRAQSLVRFRDTPDRDLPHGAAERAAWVLAGASRLVAAVRDAGPSLPVWSWAAEQTAGFWVRRMAHETVVHRADAELAVGRPVQIAADMAADGISEWLEIIPCALDDADLAALADLPGHGESLHFHATDDGLGEAGEWLVRLTPSGVVWQPGHGKGDAAVRAAAADLFLLLLRRIPPDDPRIEVLGDPRLVGHWLEHTRF